MTSAPPVLPMTGAARDRISVQNEHKLGKRDAHDRRRETERVSAARGQKLSHGVSDHGGQKLTDAAAEPAPTAVEALDDVVTELIEPYTQAQRIAVEAPAAQLVELRDDLAELREQIRELREPPAPPANFVPLKVAAWRLGTSIENPREPPPANSVAGKILAAGRRRRGEEPTAQELAAEADVDTPAVALARKIVEAGRRRRGEIK